jgi:hypothetical protein
VRIRFVWVILDDFDLSVQDLNLTITGTNDRDDLSGLGIIILLFVFLGPQCNEYL